MIKEALQMIGDFIVDKLRNELEQQGHRNKGVLQDTMRAEVSESGNGYEIVIYAKDYAKYVELPMEAGKWVSVYALAQWVEEKGIATGEKEIKSIAFAIRRKMYDEGRPTKGSLKFSKTGRRDGFIEVVMDENTKLIVQMVAEQLGILSRTAITNVVQRNKQIFETTK
jgi:hypothetical protein